MEHLNLWAKTAQAKSLKGAYHPVLYHLIDTAAVCKKLLTLLPAATVQRLQKGLQLDESGCRAWVPFLAGAHDTGKVSPPFQFQDSDALNLAQKLAGGSLYDLWNARPSVLLDKKNEPQHGIVTACTLPEYLAGKLDSVELAEELAAIVGGHHGFIPKNDDIDQIRDFPKQRKFYLGNSEESLNWKQWRLDILGELATYCGLERVTPPKSDIDRVVDPAVAVLLAAITTLSDWLASNQKCFPPSNSMELEDYIESLDDKVAKTLEAVQWQAWKPHDQPLPFSELFKFTPRGLQKAIANLMPQIKGEPALLIVEAPTGEGKTEAALTAAHWYTSSGMPGTYIGMPTQATGNALYERLKGYLNHWYPDQKINFQLVHSASALDKKFSDTICRFSDVYGENGKKQNLNGVAASEWFVHRKRALLAPWGVGTVDQALVGILRTKHQFLRLLGLAGKTIILDEVHAYDSYTARLLEQLVHWCGILGSPVVILSATLSAQQRQDLLNSYATGLGMPNPTLPEADYPRLTVYSKGKAWVDPSFTQKQLDALNQNKAIKICWVDERDIGNYLGHGPTAIIRSTVRRCQSTARRYASEQVFHSRFTQEDRQKRERCCLQTYGKPKHRSEPSRPASLLVATQVIEQSLDVDFDVLISDICPIDLLIQRIGRLWRHDRENRRVSDRTIYLIRPTPKDGLPQFGEDIEGRGVKNRYQPGVYDRHSLLRTFYLLHPFPLDESSDSSKTHTIILPGDTDTLIQQGYDLKQPPPIQLTPQQQKDWDDSCSDHEGWKSCLAMKAEHVLIPSFKNYIWAEQLTHKDVSDSDAEMVTRLINDSITVIVDQGDRKVVKARVPNKDEIRQNLLQQVRISSVGLIRAIQQASQNDVPEASIPKRWANVTYLKDIVCLEVPIQVGKYSVSYHQQYGLEVSAE